MGLKRKIDLTPIWDRAPLKNRQPRKTVSKPVLSYKKAFGMYKRLVWKLTELNAYKVIGIENREFRVLDIDHKISIYYGYRLGILPYCIADVSNLRMLDHRSNTVKSSRCFIDEDNKWIIKDITN